MNDESLVKRATNGLKVQGSMFIQSRMQSQVCPHPALLHCSISTPSTARNEYLGCVGCCWLLRCLVTQFSEHAGFLVNKSTAWSCQPCLCGWWEVIGPWIAMIGCWKWRLVINADTKKSLLNILFILLLWPGAHTIFTWYGQKLPHWIHISGIFCAVFGSIPVEACSQQHFPEISALYLSLELNNDYCWFQESRHSSIGIWEMCQFYCLPIWAMAPKL